MFLKLTQDGTANVSFVWVRTTDVIAVAEANDGPSRFSGVLLADGNQYHVKEPAEQIVESL